MKSIVTGGAGFIGSHIVDELLKEKNEVFVIDDLSSGSEKNIPKGAILIKKNILVDNPIQDLKGADVVFHFAADPDVRSSAEKPAKSFNQNVMGTFRVLEACRKADVKKFVFASTSTVYGDAKVIPTPESHPCEPISNYGASKLACEAYVSGYAHSYGIRSIVLRYANIFGPRSTHGVMFDFFRKLKTNPDKLEILGNGKQEKSYLFVSDSVSATMTTLKNQKSIFETYNVGSREKHPVVEIAHLVEGVLAVNPKMVFSGEERGWTGDVRTMLLDVSKLENMGWKVKVNLEDGVKMYMEWLSSS